MSPPKSDTKIGLFVNGKETGHQLWASEYGKQSASQTAVRFSLINEIVFCIIFYYTQKVK